MHTPPGMHALRSETTHLNIYTKQKPLTKTSLLPLNSPLTTYLTMAEKCPSPDEDETQNNNHDYNNYKKGVKHLVDTSPHMNKLPAAYVLQLQRNPFSAAYADIPVIDLSGLDQPSQSSARVATVEAISSACEIWGFFRVTSLATIVF